MNTTAATKGRPDRVTAGNPRGPIPPVDKVFKILMLASALILARRWKEKSSTPTAILDALAPSEIAAIISLLASAIYLLHRRLFQSQ